MTPVPPSDPGVPLAGGEVSAERQRLEQELRLSHQRFQAILDTTSDGYWRVDASGRILEVNDAYCRMSGYSREELLGMTVQQIDAVDSPERVVERSQQVQRDGTIHFRSKHRAKDGELLDLEISLTLVPSTQEIVAFFRDITERTRAEAALTYSEERLRALMQHSWDILSILDGEGRLVYNSPACERIHGFTVEELLGRSTVDLIHSEDAPRVADTMDWILAHPGEAGTVEYRYACKDGSWVWMEAVGVNLLDNPAIRGIVVNSRDISERKRAQAALKASEALYRGLLERQGEGFCMVDAEERFVLTNPVAETIFGVPAGGLLGRSLEEFVDEPQWNKIQTETAQRRLGQGSTYELDIRRSNGECRTILVTATPGVAQEDGGLRVIGVFRDITEAKHAEQAIREKEERFALVFQASSDAIFLSDLETGRYVEVNQAFERITGYSRDEVVGRTSMEFGLWFKPADRGAYYEELQATGSVRNRPIRIRHRDGQEVWAECNSEVMDLGGRKCMVSIARDATERMRSEESIRDANEFNDRMVATQPMGVLAYHAKSGRCVRVNEAMGRIVGASVPQLLGQNFRHLAPWKESGMLAAAERALASETEQHLETRYRSTFGKECWLSIIFSTFLAGGEGHLLMLCEDISTRKEAEAALEQSLRESREAHQHLAFQVGHLPLAYIVWDMGFRATEWNPAAEKMFGWSREEALGRSAWDLIVPPEVGDQVVRTWEEVMAGGKLGSYAINMNVTRDGRRITCEWFNTPLVDDEGRTIGVLSMAKDITDQRRTENARVESERRLRTLMEGVDQVAVMLDLEGRVTFCNDFLLQITGWYRDEVIGASWFERFIPGGDPRATTTFQEAVSRQKVSLHAENPILTRQGEERFIRWTNTLVFGDDGQVLGTASLGEDITDRQLTEMALRKASAAVDQSPAAIFITDIQGTIEYVNAAFSRITGYSQQEAVGRNPRFLKSGRHDQAFFGDLWATVLAGRTWTGRISNRRKDGRLFWEEATISPLRNDAGEITHLVASKLDVTDMLAAEEAHRLLETQVARSQKLESLGSLAGGVAHDMNNVLGAILAMASVHQLRQPEGSALRRDLDTIVKACQRGGTLVKGLLGFARKELAEERELDLNSLVKDQVDLLSRTTLQRVQLDMDLAADLPPIRGDASALSHVLMNLCLNAVDAMEGGGTLTLATSSPTPDRVCLVVSDTGCGMAKEVLEKALDPFFTTKPHGKGTGLGLPIVYGTVKAHRGQMDIESTPGKGTRVIIHLPAVSLSPGATAPVTQEPRGRGSLAVLLVDDDELIQDSVIQVLSALGHRPALAKSGEEALERLAAGLRVDVVILDLNMPGLGGARTLPQLRALRPDLPVLLATGRVDQEALNLAQAFPRVSLFPKPFSMKDLRDRLAQLAGA